MFFRDVVCSFERQASSGGVEVITSMVAFCEEYHGRPKYS